MLPFDKVGVPLGAGLKKCIDDTESAEHKRDYGNKKYFQMYSHPVNMDSFGAGLTHETVARAKLKERHKDRKAID